MSTIAYVPYTFPFIVNPTPLGAMIFSSGSTTLDGGLHASPSTTVDKYDYNANTWSNATLLLISGSFRLAESCKIYAIHGHGGTTPLSTDKYYFASDSVESGTTLLTVSNGTPTCSVGFADAYVAGWGGNAAQTAKYYYASDTTARASGLVTSPYNTPYSASGPGIAIVVAGLGTRGVDMYYWPGDYKITNTTALPGTVSGRGAGFANNDVAIVTRSLSSLVCYKMPWASGVVTSAASLHTVVSQYSQQASTSTFGILQGGQRSGDGYSVLTEKYTFASDTTTMVASAITPRRQGCGACDAPGNQ